jgi:hypothetical protein
MIRLTTKAEMILRDYSVVWFSRLSYMDERELKSMIYNEIRRLPNLIGGAGYVRSCDRSIEAQKAFEEMDSSFSELRKISIIEHPVPQKIVSNKIRSANSTEEIFNLLVEHVMPVVVLKTEDAKLEEAGLKSDMPSDWDGENRFARYDAVGIEMDQYNNVIKRP